MAGDSERERCVQTALGLGVAALFAEGGDDFRATVHVLSVLLAELGHGVRLPAARSLGDKIRCGEILVLALADAGFRGDLHPHQISGLDWKALSGALSWLKKVTLQRAEQNLDDADQTLRRPSTVPAVQAIGRSVSAQQPPQRDAPFEKIPSTISAGALSALRTKVLEQRDRINREESRLRDLDSSNLSLQQSYDTRLDFMKMTDELGRMAELVLTNEEIKSLEKEFKRTCRKERDDWTTLGEKLASEIAQTSEYIGTLKQNLVQLEERTRTYRVVGASVIREDAAILRINEELPLKEELQQYERRFVELYEQMAFKSDEHRRHISVYNHASLLVRLVNEHVALLLSIKDGFIASKSNATSANEFARQFPEVQKTSRANMEKSRLQLDAIRAKRDKIGSELQALQIKQRKYYRAVRELQECYNEQERLLQDR